MIVSPAGFLLVSAVPFRRLDLDFIQDLALCFSDALGVQVIVDVADVGLEEFFKAEFAVVAAQTGLADACVEALEGFEVLAVDIGLAVVQLVEGAHDGIPVGGVDGGGQVKVVIGRTGPKISSVMILLPCSQPVMTVGS